MTDKTDTPLTDAEAFIFPPHITCTGQVVYAHFARDLERQLAEARKDSELKEGKLPVVVKADVARRCWIKYKGVWIYVPPPEHSMTALGITPDLLEGGAE